MELRKGNECTDRLPSVRWQDENACGPEAFEIWRETCRPVFEVGNREPLQRFQADYEFYNADNVIFDRTRYSAATFERGARHRGEGECDLITLHLLLSGEERIQTGGREDVMRPDWIVVRDWAHPFQSEAEATNQLAVLIPREKLAASDWLFSRRPVVRWSLDSAGGRLLADTLGTVWNLLPHAPSAEALKLCEGFLGLLDGLLRAEQRQMPRTDAGDRHVLFLVMKRVLREHLHDPNAGVGLLTRVFSCSRSTVYRLFEPAGGVRAFLREERLLTALRILEGSAAGQPGSITKLATTLGFRDSAYFYRAFRKRFGLTPMEVAESGGSMVRSTGIPNIADGISRIHEWVSVGV